MVTITALDNNAGSMAGGQLLKLTAGGAGWNSTTLSANVISVNGLDCPVISVNSGTQQLTCRTPSMLGTVLAEYWPVNGETLNDIVLSGPSVFSKIVTNVWDDLQYEGPSGLPLSWGGLKNNFHVRYTWYFEVSWPIRFVNVLWASIHIK